MTKLKKLIKIIFLIFVHKSTLSHLLQKNENNINNNCTWIRVRSLIAPCMGIWDVIIFIKIYIWPDKRIFLCKQVWAHETTTTVQKSQCNQKQTLKKSNNQPVIAPKIFSTNQPFLTPKKKRKKKTPIFSYLHTKKIEDCPEREKNKERECISKPLYNWISKTY